MSCKPSHSKYNRRRHEEVTVQRGFEDEHAVVARLRPPRKACLEPASDQPSGDQLSQVREAFLAAILGGHRAGALNIVEEALRAGHCHVDLYVDVFAESLRRIGALWEQNKISVAQEHTATSITQYAIAAIYPRLAPTGAHRGSMVVTGVAGELHQVGANLVADAMEAKGWTVRFLGTNLPHSSVMAAVEESSVSVLCISTTIVANLPSVVDLLERSATNSTNGCRESYWAARHTAC